MRVGDGAFAVMSAADEELGLAGLKSYTWLPGGTPFVVVLFDTEKAQLAAVIEADKMGQLRTGAASGVAAKYLAKPEAKTLGVIGCGWQAESQVACIREAVPTIESVVAYCRTEEKLEAFCKKVGAEPGESHRDPAEQDIVVTVTTSKDPVLRGEWLQPGALVCAVGANEPRARELDNAVLERAVFVCCDSIEQCEARGGRPDRARRARRPRLARGARAARGGLGRDRRPQLARRHRPLQVERPRRVGRRDRREGDRARAARRRSGRRSNRLSESADTVAAGAGLRPAGGELRQRTVRRPTT